MVGTTTDLKDHQETIILEAWTKQVWTTELELPIPGVVEAACMIIGVAAEVGPRHLRTEITSQKNGVLIGVKAMVIMIVLETEIIDATIL